MKRKGRIDLPLERASSAASQDHKRGVDQVDDLGNQVLGTLAIDAFHYNPYLQLRLAEQLGHSVGYVQYRPLPLFLRRIRRSQSILLTPHDSRALVPH